MNKKKNGYVLLITIVVCFFISLVTITSLVVVGRYNSSIQQRQEQLAETVYVQEESSL